jgi:adenylate cyclase
MTVLRRLLSWAGEAACLPGDSGEERVRKASLTLMSILIMFITPIYVATYLLLGQPLAAAIPFTYVVITLIDMAVLFRTKRYERFRFVQLALMVALPCLLQASLGGFEASSAVALWALTAPLASLVFYGPRRSIAWFVAYGVMIGVLGALDPILSRHSADVPQGIRLGFFVLTVAAVSLTCFLLLRHFVLKRDEVMDDLDRAHRALMVEQEKSEGLLLNILPGPIAELLKREHGVVAERYDEVTVLFGDIVGFTPLSEGLSPEDTVRLLDQVFTGFDRLAEALGLEKIKTIGDAYMVVGGLPEPRDDHAEAVAEMALGMRKAVAGLCPPGRTEPLSLRIGIDTGSVVAGVIGRTKFSYDLWGDIVNTASRMESHGMPNEIQVSANAYLRLRHRYHLVERGVIDVKGKGPMPTWLLVGPLEEGSRQPAPAAVPDRA